MAEITRDDLNKMIDLLKLIQEGVNATSERLSEKGMLYAKLDEVSNNVAPVDKLHEDRIALLLRDIRNKL
jgi:hypothetical protein